MVISLLSKGKTSQFIRKCYLNTLSLNVLLLASTTGVPEKCAEGMEEVTMAFTKKINANTDPDNVQVVINGEKIALTEDGMCVYYEIYRK